MAQERVRQWAIRFVPEGTDTESKVKRIRAQTDTQVLDTWDAPFLARADWCAEMEALLDMVAEQLPTRKHSVTFTAEDAAGAVLSQCGTWITGKNKDAADHASPGGPKALADAMNSMAATMERIMASGRLQCDSLGKTVDTLSTQVQDLVELHKVKTEREIVERENGGASGIDNELGQLVVKKIEEYAPPLIELGQMYFESKGVQRKTSAANAILHAVTTTNGKAS
jgi:hypothetical protein